MMYCLVFNLFYFMISGEYRVSLFELHAKGKVIRKAEKFKF